VLLADSFLKCLDPISVFYFVVVLVWSEPINYCMLNPNSAI